MSQKDKKNSIKRPPVFMPENEPYLGLKSVFWFDRLICWTLEGNTKVAKWTIDHRSSMTQLQLAACQIIPQGISIALSFRELIRQGYLFSAMILIRPLIERAAVISYLDLHPDAVTLWESGWKHGERPSLATMMNEMSGRSSKEEAQKICSEHNHIVHGDPLSCYHNIIHLNDGSIGYASGKILNNHELCDGIAMEAQCYLVVLAGRMSRIFSDVDIPQMPKEDKA